MIRMIRVGMLLVGMGWQGGVSYIESLVRAVKSLPTDDRPQLYFIVGDYTLDSFDAHRSFVDAFDGIFLVGHDRDDAMDIIQQPFNRVESISALAPCIDFFYPIMYDGWPSLCSASWIPDFQYLHLPHFFPQEDLTYFSQSFKKVATESRLVVFSSNDAKKDFQDNFPNSRAITRVLSFHVSPRDAWFQGNPSAVQSKYGLTDHFLLCCNQFWQHKNHLCLFEAVARLRQEGTIVNVVCTGGTHDYRSQDYFSRVQEAIGSMRISDQIHVLGDIPRDDQIQLMRMAMAVVQPSLFEGWSTVVEEARALGKTMILSDLAVNIEQAPKHAVYFQRESPEDLVRVLKDLVPTLSPGPDGVREMEAHNETATLVEHFGRRFCSLVTEAQFIYGRKIRGMSDTLWGLLNEQNVSSEMTRTTAGPNGGNELIDASDQGRAFNVACPHCEAAICISHRGTWQCPCCQNNFVV